MSLVVAKKCGECVFMGADSLTSIGDYRKASAPVPEDRKIVQMPGGVLVGATGNVRVLQVLTDNPGWFEILGTDELEKRFLVQWIVPNLYQELKDRGFLEEADTARMEASFLFAKGGRLFRMDPDFSVSTVTEFDAIGCGEDAAVAVYLQSGEEKPRELLLECLRLAAGYDSSIGAPFFLIDTQTKTFSEVKV